MPFRYPYDFSGLNTWGAADNLSAVAGDLIQFEIMPAVALPDGTIVDSNGKIARMRFKGLAASGAQIDRTKMNFFCRRPGWNRAKVFSANNTINLLVATKIENPGYPTDAAFITQVVGSDIDIYVAISETVFIADAVDSVAVTAGFYGACTSSSLALGTNSSTQPYPKPQHHWHQVEPYARLGSTGLDLEAIIDHWGARDGQPVPVTEFYAVQGGATKAIGSTNAMVWSNHPSASGFRPPVFRATIPVGSLADGAATIGIRSYPWVGNALWDDAGAATIADAYPCINHPKDHPITVDLTDTKHTLCYGYLSKTGLAVGSPAITTVPPGNLAYVQGTTPAFADETTFAAAVKAFNTARGHNDMAGGRGVIPDGFMKAGFTASLGSAVTYPIGLGLFGFIGEPGATKVGTGFTSGGTSKVTHSRGIIENMEVRPGAGGAVTHIVFDGGTAGLPTAQQTEAAAVVTIIRGCVGVGFDDNTNAVFYRAGYRYLFANNFDSYGDDIASQSTANPIGMPQFYGNVITCRGTIKYTIAAFGGCAGNQFFNVYGGDNGAGVVQPIMRGWMWWMNRVDGDSTTVNTTFGNGSALDDRGASIGGNVFRQSVAGGTPNGFVGGRPVLQFSADYVSNQDRPAVSNLLMWGNTCAGGRANLLYCEATTGMVFKVVQDQFNHLAQQNCKGNGIDPDGAGTGVSFDGTRRGHSAYRNGTDRLGSTNGEGGADSFGTSAFGTRNFIYDVIPPGSAINIGNANAVENDNSFTGTNASYLMVTELLPKAALRNRIPAGQARVSHDLKGRGVPNNGTGAAGAYQLVA